MSSQDLSHLPEERGRRRITSPRNRLQGTVLAIKKDVLVARLKETFDFCSKALAGVDDSKLGEQLPFFGGKTRSRAGIMTITTGDWADHYSQVAIYLRLNGVLPPTAKK